MKLTEWNELAASLRSLPPEALAELDELLLTFRWLPLPGPQTEAFQCKADVLFYGGAAGGGKTDLAIGLALTAHDRSIIYRRAFPQLLGIVDRMAEILGSRNGYNGNEQVWRVDDGRQVEFGSCPNAGDETKYQGRPHDLKVFDEITHFLESQARFLMGWKRSRRQGQRQRVVFLGNPPTDSDGEWVIRYFAPWLDQTHPNPAKPGELRWFAVLNGKDVEVAGPEPFEHTDDNGRTETIEPHSRTFIPSHVQDNPYLMSTGYMQTLQALPEPLRSQMLRGDFNAGRTDDPMQVIPTEWVRAAQARWTDNVSHGTMDAVGVDVARGGKDQTVIARRYGNWYAPLLTYPGVATPDGPTVASLVVSAMRNGAPVHVDIIGVGASVYDHLAGSGVQCIGVNGAEGSDATDRSGHMRFVNKRAELWWKFREELDPTNDTGIALPPDDALRADLCTPRWRYTARGCIIESKDDIIRRIERSPDRGDAVVYASIATVRGKLKPLLISRKYIV